MDEQTVHPPGPNRTDEEADTPGRGLPVIPQCPSSPSERRGGQRFVCGHHPVQIKMPGTRASRRFHSGQILSCQGDGAGRGSARQGVERARWIGAPENFMQKGQMVNIVSRDLRNKLTSDTSAISKTSRDVSEASVCRRFHRARGTRRDLCRTETRGRQFRQHRIPARPHRIAGHWRGQRYFRQTWETAGHREIKNQGDSGTALISMLLVSAITAVPAMRELDHGN